MAVFNPRDIAAQQASPFFDVPLRQAFDFPELAQSLLLVNMNYPLIRFFAQDRWIDMLNPALFTHVHA